MTLREPKTVSVFATQKPTSGVTMGRAIHFLRILLRDNEPDRTRTWRQWTSSLPPVGTEAV